MERALLKFEEIKDREASARKIFYILTKLKENYESCINQCKRNSNNVMCLYDQTSTTYAVTSIKIYEPECSEFQDYTDVISFATTLENDVQIPFPNGKRGLIPNFKYVIGDPQIFRQKHVLHSNSGEGYYLITLKIPFVM
jgi:hypothetical protein